MPITLSMEDGATLELGGMTEFIGSAYAPQVDVTDTETGHEVSITYDDAGQGITTKTFDVEDGADGAEGYSPTATVTQLADGATIRITDKDGTTTATVHDGIDGTNGQDGYSPTATVTQTATGATISITDRDGTTTATVSNGADGSDGADGFSPTVGVQPITGGHEVTITDSQGEHSFDVMDGDPAEPGSITDEMLAPDGIKAQVAQLWGNQLKATLTGDLLTASDAYAAPPMALTVDGRSTQDGTPTPSAPVPIVSVDSVELHASADGTTDYGDWPVTLYDGTLRSLPDGTKDTLALSYLRPSTREGWAWYSRELVEQISMVDMGTLTWSRVYPGETYEKFWAQVPGMSATTEGVVCLCSNYSAVTTTSALANMADKTFCKRSTFAMLMLKDTDYSSVPDLKASLSGIYAQYILATPITTQLDPIELPVLPAPTCTVWSDPTTGLTMEYVQDSNLVVQSLSAETAIVYASIATVDGPTATASHAVGTYLTMGGVLYKVTRAIAVGETIAAGTNVTQTTVMAELIARTA